MPEHLLSAAELQPWLASAEPPLVLHAGNAEDYLRGHLPGALPVSPAALNRGGRPSPGYLPDVSALTAAFAAVGLTDTRPVVVYDSAFGTAAGRLIWVLEALGLQNWRWLHGGLADWQRINGDLHTRPAQAAPSAPVFALNPQAIADKAAVRAALDNPDDTLVDARSAEEYAGLKPENEPRGRIPGAVHFDWRWCLAAPDRAGLKTPAALQALLAEHGLNTPQQNMIVYCRSHQRSAFLYAVLRALGFSRVRGYAGSWLDWGSDPDLPVA